MRALTRVATAGNEEELLAFAKAGTAAHVEKLVRLWRRTDRLAEQEQERLRHAGRYLRAYTDEDGMVVLQARLDPEAGAALLKALAAAADKLYDAGAGSGESGEPVTAEQRRADALGLVAESALAGGLDPGTRGDRYQVVLHVDAEALQAEGDSGTAALEDGRRGWVAPGGYPPGAPTDPDVRDSRIRLLGLRIRPATVDAVDDSRRRQGVPRE